LPAFDRRPPRNGRARRPLRGRQQQGGKPVRIGISVGGLIILLIILWLLFGR
jgi:hypothetical protein